jgi:hypothetical protein
MPMSGFPSKIQQVAVAVIFGDFVDLVGLEDQDGEAFGGLPVRRQWSSER